MNEIETLNIMCDKWSDDFKRDIEQLVKKYDTLRTNYLKLIETKEREGSDCENCGNRFTEKVFIVIHDSTGHEEFLRESGICPTCWKGN